MQSATKPKTLAIDATLHGYLNLIRSRDPRAVKQMKELVEPRLWEVVREHREWLEMIMNNAVEIPDAAQAEMKLA